jgi:hypothetical protein
MSRLFLSIAICFPTFFCLNSHADESASPPVLVEYAAALVRGAEDACMMSERATKRCANMLQASCVAAEMSAGIDRSEIVGHCFGASNRSTFEEFAEVVCGNFKI